MHSIRAHSAWLYLPLLGVCCASAATAKWEVIHKTTKEIWGPKNRHSIRCLFASCCATTAQLQLSRHHVPSCSIMLSAIIARCRYSHCTGVSDDQLVITHGYFYNTESKGAQWLSDTWTMSLHSPYAMHQIHRELRVLCLTLQTTAAAVCLFCCRGHNRCCSSCHV